MLGYKYLWSIITAKYNIGVIILYTDDEYEMK